MSLTGNSYEKKQRPIPPQGPQIARCYMICDVGTHMKQFMNQPAVPTPLVHFGWEMVNLPHAVFDEQKGPQPLAVFQEYSVSLGDKSKLKKLLSSWRGVEPKDLAKELPAFIGQPCMIDIKYANDKQKPEIIYANISGNGTGVMRLMQGVQANNLTNKTIFFNLDNYSHQAFLELPAWLQKKIKTSLEWNGIVQKFGNPPEQPQIQNNQQNNTGFTQNQNQGLTQNQPVFTPPATNKFVNNTVQQTNQLNQNPIHTGANTNDPPPF